MSDLNVLIAEDDNLNRMMISRLLERLGAKCATAEDGRQAVDMEVQDTYDIVFLDYNMPVYSGAECAEIIRERSEKEGRVKPLLVCVSADEDIGDEGLFDDRLPKPFKVEKIQEILERVLKEA